MDLSVCGSVVYETAFGWLAFADVITSELTRDGGKSFNRAALTKFRSARPANGMKESKSMNTLRQYNQALHREEAPEKQ